MKKLTLLFFLLITAIVYGQQVPPQGINFQAVLFDEYGTPVPSLNENSTLNNQSAEATFTFYNLSSGLNYYSEAHNISTDEFGRFQVVLGRGTPLGSNSFQDIQWSDGDIFLDFEVALNGQSKRLVSSQELLSVPYALLAEKAMVAQTAVDVDDADADPTNEIQVLSASNDTIFLSSGGYVVLSPDQINDADADPSNEIQSLNVSGDSLTLSSGNTVQLPVINDADADPTNEIQTITRNGVSITLSGNGGSISVFDGDYNNLTNTPTIPANTSDLTNDSGFITTEVDGSTTNELQSLSVSGDSLTLSNGGGSIFLPNSTLIDTTNNSFWYDYDNGQLKHLIKAPGARNELSLGYSARGQFLGSVDIQGGTSIYRITLAEDIYFWGAVETYQNVNQGGSPGTIQVYLDNDTIFSNGLGTLVYQGISAPTYNGQYNILRTFKTIVKKEQTMWIKTTHITNWGGWRTSASVSWSQVSLPPEISSVKVFNPNGTTSNMAPQLYINYKPVVEEWKIIKDYNSAW